VQAWLTAGESNGERGLLVFILGLESFLLNTAVDGLAEVEETTFDT